MTRESNTDRKSVMGKRLAYKPFDHPNVLRFRESIKQSRWDIVEFNLKKDAFEFNQVLSNIEQEAIKRVVLVISQVEASGVKNFWIKFTQIFTKAEFVSVGITFGENEVVHAEAYSKILDELGFNDEFEKALENPVLMGRVNYLRKYLTAKEGTMQEYMMHLLLFCVIMENVYLFGYFATIKSFRKHKNQLKEIDSIIDATMKEETLHAQFGMEVINMVKAEKPEWFDDVFYERVNVAVKKALDAEIAILDWIFEEGEIESISKATLVEYIKRRFNNSLETIGGKPIFEVDEDVVKELDWVDYEADAYIRNDFFDTQSTNYNKYNKSYSADDLFG